MIVDLQPVHRAYYNEWYYTPNLGEITGWINDKLKETSGKLETMNVVRNYRPQDPDAIVVFISILAIDPNEKRKLEESFYRGE